MQRTIYILLMVTFFISWQAPTLLAQDARDIVKASFNHYRGKASQAVVEMIIQRPDWQRSMQIKAWTKGTGSSFIRIVAPSKDKGNATLKKRHEMWTYNPKVNRVIKLPPALMSQSWMGSDFSNNDLAKSDSILNDYQHRIINTENHQNHTVYVIESMPKPQAPVVWGKQVLKIRDDHILLSQEFFDEEMQTVKHLTTSDIQMLGGRMFPKVWKMQEIGVEDQFTLLRYHELQFLDTLPDRLFTITQLKNPTRR